VLEFYLVRKSNSFFLWVEIWSPRPTGLSYTHKPKHSYPPQMIQPKRRLVFAFLRMLAFVSLEFLFHFPLTNFIIHHPFIFCLIVILHAHLLSIQPEFAETHSTPASFQVQIPSNFGAVTRDLLASWTSCVPCTGRHPRVTHRGL
jgi:hypothetical protein